LIDFLLPPVLTSAADTYASAERRMPCQPPRLRRIEFAGSQLHGRAHCVG